MATYPNKNKPAHLPDTFRDLPYDGTYFITPEDYHTHSHWHAGLTGPGEFVMYSSRWSCLSVPTSVIRLVDKPFVNDKPLSVGQNVWVEFLPGEEFHEWEYIEGKITELYEESKYARVRFRGGMFHEDIAWADCMTYNPGDPKRTAYVFRELPKDAVGWCHYCGGPAYGFGFFDEPACKGCGGR